MISFLSLVLWSLGILQLALCGVHFLLGLMLKLFSIEFYWSVWLYNFKNFILFYFMGIELDNFKKDDNLNHKEEMYLFYSK
jgi:hypothetical protein